MMWLNFSRRHNTVKIKERTIIFVYFYNARCAVLLFLCDIC